MRPDEFRVDPDIRFASTPPAALHGDGAWWTALAEKVLARSWHVVALAADVAAKESVRPVTLLPGVLGEPLLLTRDRKDRLHCLSNVCTHRGNLVAPCAGPAKLLRCGAHGRTFRLDGELTDAPGMEGALGFPSPADSLTRVAVATWGSLVFASLDPSTPFEDVIAPVRERFIPLELAAMTPDAVATLDDEVGAHWLLCAERLLECGDVAPRSALFPTTFIDVHPWGLTVQSLAPLTPTRTRVRRFTFVADAARRPTADAAHPAPLRDDAVLAQMQQCVGARLRSPSRYAPRDDAAIHRFHAMLADRLAAPPHAW